MTTRSRFFDLVRELDRRASAAGLTRRRRNVASALLLVPLWGVLAAALPNGLPAGVIGLGVVLGALASFSALGLVLIYRSSRIVNFAQAEIGGVAAALSVVLVTNRGTNYFVAVPIGLALALAFGALIEVAVVRRFIAAPRLILTVATIGVAQILGAAAISIPNLLPAPEGQGIFGANVFTTPFEFRFRIAPVTFNGNHLLALLSVVAVLAFLVYLFSRTDAGIGVRGAADSQERAVLLGLPVRRLSVLTWVVAAGMSGLAGILSAGVVGPATGSAAGPRALLTPLAAAVLARFESLPTTFVASIAIGVFTQGVFWNYPQATTVDVALFGVILTALLLQRRQTTRVAGEDFGSFVGTREVPVLPRAVRRLPEFRVARITLAALAAAGVLALPAISTDARVVLYSFIAIYAIIGISLVVLTGWAGQVSLGQFGFVGLGAATSGSLMANAGVDYLWSLLAACIVGATVAVLIGIPALRLPGLFLAPVTIAFAVATSSYFLNPQYFPWFTPLQVDPPFLFDRYDLAEPNTFYFTCLAGVAISAAVARNLRRTRIGRAVIASRDNERFASGVSISPVRVKLIAFATSGALAGLAGGLYVLAIRGLPFGGFSPDLSVQLFTMVVVGGLTSVLGAILGALYVYFAQYLFSGAAQLLATGAGLLVILLLAPGGLADLLYRVRDAAVRGMVRRRGMTVQGFSEGRSPTPPNPELAASRSSRGPSPSPRSHDALLRCQDIDAAYGHLQILFGVDVAISPKSITAILGTNGAGKTTTLKCIAGLLPISTGSIRFDGEDITSLGPVERVKRGIVMVPAKGIFGSLTVRENLRLGGWVPRHTGDKTFYDEGLQRVFGLFPRLEERLDQKASLLSGGEQQMLAIAQGLLARPRLLLVDELSLGLAPVVVNAIVGVLRDLNADGLPVVVVEQSINVSATVADESIFIEKGEVRFTGPTPELVARDDIISSVFFGSGPSENLRARPTRSPAERNGDDRTVFAASNVSKAYGPVTAVSDLCLEVRQGQVLGIIGSNGAGKTTAFDIFSGFTTPDTGNLTYNGIDVSDMTAAQRAALGFGRTFQDVRLVPALTAAETLAVSLERHIEVREPVASMMYVGATARSERRVRSRVEELLEAFQLDRYRDTCINELSTGTRRVLEIACAAGHRSSFMLLDEPSSGLSQAESEDLADVLVGLAESTHATLAIIEHDVPLVSGLADELICMDLGRIIARGRPRDVLANPDVVRSYLGGADPVAATSAPQRRRQLRARVKR